MPDTKFKDLTGQTFGLMKVTGFAGWYEAPNGSRQSKWHTKCTECGKESVKTVTTLKKGKCTCQIQKKIKGIQKPTLRNDLTGRRFGKVTVLERIGMRNGSTYYKCKCDCGNEFETQQSNLLSGAATSCGCEKKGTVQNLNKYRAEVFQDDTRLDTPDLPPTVNSQTGVRGVYWDKERQKYAVYVILRGKRKYIGRYLTLEQAEIAREKAVHDLYDPIIDEYLQKSPDE